MGEVSDNVDLRDCYLTKEITCMKSMLICAQLES